MNGKEKGKTKERRLKMKKTLGGLLFFLMASIAVPAEKTPVIIKFEPLELDTLIREGGGVSVFVEIRKEIDGRIVKEEKCIDIDYQRKEARLEAEVGSAVTITVVATERKDFSKIILIAGTDPITVPVSLSLLPPVTIDVTRGGYVINPDGVNLTIPQNACQDAFLFIRTKKVDNMVLSKGWPVEGTRPVAGYEIVARAINGEKVRDFDRNLTLSLSYAEEVVGNENALQIIHLSERDFRLLGGRVDTTAKTVTVETSRLSWFVIVEVTSPVDNNSTSWGKIKELFK
jgi:hypothetical protein